MWNELLTDDESSIIHDAGTLFTRIVEEVIEDGPNRENDTAELRALVHGIQNMILRQAAARAYPDRYRLLGASLR